MSAEKKLYIISIYIAFTLLLPVKAQADTKGVMQCWPAQTLSAKRTEKYPQYRTKKARIAPPEIRYVRQKPVTPGMRGSIRRVTLPPGKKLIALTLDLCEAPWEISGYDGDIIDFLRKHNIKATLFVSGKWLLSHPERAQQLVADPLFELGNHAWTHGNFRNINRSSMFHQIINTQKAYQVTRQNMMKNACIARHKRHINKPAQIKLFRFPYGACRPDSLKMVGDNGLLAIQWDVAAGDPSRRQSAKRIARQILRNTKPGSIIIAHANGRGWHTAKALPLFVPKLIEKGYRFVTVSELLAAGKPVISKYCYDSVPGDTNRYDRPRKRHQRKIRVRLQRQF